MVKQMVRLSATVPKHIFDETNEIAAASNISRSQLISELLTEMIQRRKQELLVEGYKALAKQHEEFVSLSQDTAKETLPVW